VCDEYLHFVRLYQSKKIHGLQWSSLLGRVSGEVELKFYSVDTWLLELQAGAMKPESDFGANGLKW